jgi:hypothetical protein
VAVGDQGGELGPVGDPELAVDPREVRLDRLGAHERGRRDLAVRHPRRRELRDAQLRGRELGRRAPQADAPQLGPRLLRPRRRAELLEERDAFLVLNLYSMGLSSTLARTAVRQTFGEPQVEQYGELTFTDRAGKELPLGTYYRFKR